jgi:DNA polymerase-4
MEKQRDILHIDMNSFYASCEQARNKELKNKPVIVAGDPNKRSGIVLAASYEAKSYGVRTTMQLNKALKLCKDAIIVKADHSLYLKMSKGIMDIFDEYTPLKQQISIDEAFLDMTGTTHLFGHIIEASKKIQNRILEELDMPCSVGISTNRLLAKMGSDYKKPMGITTIYPYEVKEKLWHLPVGKLYGVGKKTSVVLNSLGIKTIGDLATTKIDLLTGNLGYKTSKLIIDSANGISSHVVNPGSKEVKSIGNENTFSRDLVSIEDIKREILLICDLIGFRLRKNLLKGRTISIKVKYNDFKVITRSKTINYNTDSTDLIYRTAIELIRNHNITKPIRLLGVTVFNFENTDINQISLFDNIIKEEDTEKDKHIDLMVDSIRDKYGYGAITRASIVNNNRKPKLYD